MPVNVFDIINPQYRLVKQKGDVGIEIEVETKSLLDKPSPLPWRNKGDGSLRGNGYEFITLNPLSVKDKDKEIDSICDFISKINPVHDSPRTSVHVHCNIQDLTVVQTWTFLTAYYLLENLLFKFCSPDREGNTFCPRLSEVDSAVDGFINDVKYAIPFTTFRADKYKYMGGSPYCITRFGSFELRGLEGGKYNAKQIKNWTDIILHLKEASKKYASPALLLDRYFYIGGAILPELLPLEFISFFTSQKGWQGLLKDNACLIGHVAYSVDWLKYEVMVEQEAVRYKDMLYKPKATQFAVEGQININPVPPNPVFVDEIDF